MPGLEPRQWVSTTQDGAGHSQEIHYATPMFQQVAPGDHGACNDYKTGYVYSELIFWNVKIQITSQGKMLFLKLIYVKKRQTWLTLKNVSLGTWSESLFCMIKHYSFDSLGHIQSCHQTSFVRWDTDRWQFLNASALFRHGPLSPFPYHLKLNNC